MVSGVSTALCNNINFLSTLSCYCFFLSFSYFFLMFVYFVLNAINLLLFYTIYVATISRWIWYQPRDSDNQLQWLADTLLQAEKDEEFVHILGHIPAASEECQSTWKREYLKIVDRFAHIVKAQFNGHTHNDELELLYSSGENKKVNNVAWNGGSLTTFTQLNPNYKVYIVDSENYVSVVPLKCIQFKFTSAAYT